MTAPDREPIRLANTSPKKILILRVGAMGDIIFALPAIALLRERFPEAEIHWVIKAGFAPFFEEQPDVDVILPLTPSASGIWRMARRLRRERYELVIDLHGNLRSGILSRATGCRDRVGFDGPYAKEGNGLFNRHQVLPPEPSPHRVERDLSLIRALPGVPQDRVPAPRLPPHEPFVAGAEAKLRAAGWQGERLFAVISGASARGAIKRWDPLRFAEVTRELSRATGARGLLLWGSPSEREEARVIQEAAGCEALLPERFAFRELAAALERCDLAIGVDTGPLHLANALQTPVVGIYGPKAPEIYKPYHSPERVVARNAEAGCPPCNAARCHNPAGRVCLEAISAADVIEAALSLWSSAPAR